MRSEYNNNYVFLLLLLFQFNRSCSHGIFVLPWDTSVKDSYKLLLNAKRNSHYVFVKVIIMCSNVTDWYSSTFSFSLEYEMTVDTSAVSVHPSIQVVDVYLELLRAAWYGEGRAVLLHVLHLLLFGLPRLLLQHRLADLQQQALRGRRVHTITPPQTGRGWRWRMMTTGWRCVQHLGLPGVLFNVLNIFFLSIHIRVV